jgi:outer membrane protein assembly factor BamB
MSQTMRWLLIFLLFGCLIFFSCPPSEQFVTRAESLSDEELETGKASLTYKEAFVIFISGEAYVQGQGDWESLEIGNIVHPDEVIKVGDNSLCELQFGEQSVIRIKENTEVFVKDLWLKPAETDIDLDLAVGSVLCKVSKLSGAESFKVRTRTAVCGVRGTEFSVSFSEAKETVLAVKEGTVAILPESAEADNIQEQEKIKNTDVRAMVEKLEMAALLVTKDHEVTIDEKTAREAANIVNDMVGEVRNADQKEELTKAELVKVDTLVTETNEKINKIINSPRKLSTENEEDLKALDQLEIKEVIVEPEEAAEVPGKEEEEKVPILVKIRIRTEPKDAEIYLDGSAMGKGKLQIINEEGTSLNFIVQKQGYKKESLVIEVKKSGQKEYNVVLQKLPGNEMETGEEAEKSKALNKEELNKEAALKAEKEKKPAVIEREVVPIKRIKAAPSSFIGDIMPAAELFVVADKQGTLYALDKNGSVAWSLTTSNNPNYNSWPAVIGGNIYFAGARELVIVKADSGELLKKRTLKADENQMFGRRIVALGDNGLFPTDNTIQVIDLQTGDSLKQFTLPGSSLMTPQVFQGKIYLVSLSGEVIVIDIKSGAAESRPLQTEAMGPVALPMSIFQGKGYFCGRKGLLVAVDLNNRRILWQRKLEANANIYPHQEIIAEKQGIYLFAAGKIYGFSCLNGTPLFRPLSGATTPPLYLQNKIYYGRDDGTLVIADASTGNIQRLIKIDARISSRPFVLGKKLILATEKGEILLVEKVLK